MTEATMNPKDAELKELFESHDTGLIDKLKELVYLKIAEGQLEAVHESGGFIGQENIV